MKSVIRYLVMIISALLGLALMAGMVLNIIAQIRLNTRYEISIDPIVIPESESAHARGEHLVRAVSSCGSCHGSDLGGKEFINQPMLGRIYAPNLTSGNGGIASRFNDEDWVRALRHGIDQNGRPLMFMPSQYFRRYSDDDLGAIIAYIRSLPPVDRETPPRQISVIGRILLSLSVLEAMPAEMIDHHALPSARPPEGVSPEYGEFLVTVGTCKNCHGENLAGGQVGPDDPFAPNLTPGGELVGWTEQDFIDVIRTGIHPSGRTIDPLMPWQSFRHMTDTELRAIWVHLQILPALPTNED